MSNPRFEDLLQRHLDGATSAAEDAELRQVLSQSNEAQTLADDLASLQEALRNAREMDPPASLRDQILTRVHAASPPWSMDETRTHTAGTRNPSGGRSPWQRLLDALRNGVRPREGVAFALGTAVGVFLLFLAGTVPFDGVDSLSDNSLPGSMMPLDDLQNMQVVDQTSWEAAGFRGRAGLLRAGDSLLLSVELDSGSDVTFQAVFDPEILRVGGIVTDPGGAPLSTRIRPDGIEIQHTGIGLYSIALQDRNGLPTEVRLSIRGNHETITKTLRTSR